MNPRKLTDFLKSLRIDPPWAKADVPILLILLLSPSGYSVAVTLGSSRTITGHFPSKRLFCLPLLTWQATIEERKEAFMLQNEAASIRHCQAELAKLSEFLRESISSGAFSVPGGHGLYVEARKKVELGYEQVLRKGVKVRNSRGSGLRSSAECWPLGYR